MASSVPLQVAETVQTAHINWRPSASHDINPSTASSRKEPVELAEKRAPVVYKDEGIDESDDERSSEDEDGVPYSLLRRKPRRSHFPPIPDLRYEQSYLHSIRNADTWWKVVLLTTRDQIFMPFMQGILYNLAICGWQHWNRNARLHGSSAGARLRRWWYRVNNWQIPSQKAKRF